MKPEPSGNLLLCAHASLAEGDRLFLSDAGLQSPPAGDNWYLAGVIDLPLSAYLESGHLRVVDLQHQPVPGAPTGKLVSELEGDPESDDEAVLRVPIVLRLPTLAGLADDTIYYWGGDLRRLGS